MPGLLLLVVHTTGIFKLAKCEVLGLIPHLDNYEILDSNPKRDKLEEWRSSVRIQIWKVMRSWV